jgi:hypothetical protein
VAATVTVGSAGAPMLTLAVAVLPSAKLTVKVKLDPVTNIAP